MNIPSCVESGSVTKTMLIRFKGNTNKSVWIDGAALMEQGWDMEEHLKSLGVEFFTAFALAKDWEVAEVEEEEKELFQKHCFGVYGFKCLAYEELVSALDKHSAEKVQAAIDCGIELDDIEDMFVVEGDFRKFVIQDWFDMSSGDLPEQYIKFINEDTVYDLHSEGYVESGGFIFHNE